MELTFHLSQQNSFLKASLTRSSIQWGPIYVQIGVWKGESVITKDANSGYLVISTSVCTPRSPESQSIQPCNLLFQFLDILQNICKNFQIYVKSFVFLLPSVCVDEAEQSIRFDSRSMTFSFITLTINKYGECSKILFNKIIGTLNHLEYCHR